MSLLGVTPSGPQCSCHAPPGGRHTVTCLAVAYTAPHAMVSDDGDVFYPDSLDDARQLATGHGARPVNASALADFLGCTPAEAAGLEETAGGRR